MDSISLPKVISNLKATYRKGEFWRCEYPVTNQYAAAFHTLTNVGVLANGTNADIVTTNTGSIFVPKNPETFTYDLDGNLTSDGHWTNSWDAENRLIQMETISSVPIQAKQKLVFSYDHQSRRIRKVVYNWNTNTSQYYVGLDLKFLYDAWNLIAELNGTNNNLICSYMWGSDLSGSMQSAGGVGGLLCVNHTQMGAQFPAYDGNGNVIGFVDAIEGTNAISYEYSPFGVRAKQIGEAAKTNPLRFSTRYSDDESDSVYYGHRHRHSSTSRWMCRDPIADFGMYFVQQASQNPATPLPDAQVDSLSAAHHTRKAHLTMTYQWRWDLTYRINALLGQLPGANVNGFVDEDPINSFDLLGLLKFGSNCSAQQQADIRAAIADACKNAKNNNCFRCLSRNGKNWMNGFCDDTATGTDEASIQCDDSTTNPDCASNCGASVYWSRNIHLCFNNINNSTICPGMRCTIIHEATHGLAGRGETQAYGIEKCTGCQIPAGQQVPPGY